MNMEFIIALFIIGVIDAVICMVCCAIDEDWGDVNEDTTDTE